MTGKHRAPTTRPDPVIVLVLAVIFGTGVWAGRHQRQEPR